MEIVLKTEKGNLIHGDNIEVMKTFKDESFDNCISDFPYNLGFMGKKWDSQKNFYDWNYERALGLYRIIKKGGYVLIFGHHKTNHRMKCAFEDAGFNIVEEIDWIYGSGFPKNQDISKMFDKKVGVKRKIIGYSQRNDRKLPNGEGGTHGNLSNEYSEKGRQSIKLKITEPTTDLAKQWDGWKTSGLKPAKEIITVFQKPIDKNYCNNIEKYNCGAMNIDTCRVPISQKDINMLNAKSSKNPTTNYSDKEDKIYGAYAEDKAVPANELGRFPSNIIFDDSMGEVLDSQSGWLKSGAIKKGQSAGTDWNSGDITHERKGGRKPQPKNIPSNEGGASRYFLNINFEKDDYTSFYYCPKPTKKEKGTENKHITVKPKKLIKWLVKLVTPINGKSLDITAGSCTHGLCCEELNNEEEYSIEWTNIELFNDEENPYCDIGKKRINTYLHNKKIS